MGRITSTKRSGKVVLRHEVEGSLAVGYHGEKYAVTAVIITAWASDGTIDIQFEGSPATDSGARDRRRTPRWIIPTRASQERIIADLGIDTSAQAAAATLIVATLEEDREPLLPAAGIVTDLGPHQMTLYPATPGDRTRAIRELPVWQSLSDGRFVVDMMVGGTAVRPTLPDRWQRITTSGGITVEVRRTACGAGCRCAGEFRFAG